MANQWLRLWHDMPTDPKWRTISKVSGQRIGDVIAVFTHLLVCASNATERGRTHSFNCEDVASALDLETEQVTAIIDAMQSRVLDGDKLKGWESRQVAREDGSAERAKAWREAQKAKTERTPNAPERKQTPDKDTDKDTDKKNTKTKASAFVIPDWIDQAHWDTWHSCAKRNKATDEQKALAVETLSEWKNAGLDYKTALKNAAVGGWQGLFLPDQQAAGKPAKQPLNKQQALEQRNRAVAEEWLRQQEINDASV
jgi:hypothetical protein